MPSYKDIVSKKFGDVVFDASLIVDSKKEVFSVSPAIDIALSGGVPEGSWVSFIGPPGCGKSTTALQLLANAQSDKYSIKKQNRKAFYLDVEHRLKPMNLKGIHGLKADEITLVRSTPQKQLSAQEFLEILKQIICDPQNFGGIAVIDSTSALCPGEEIGEDISGMIRSTMPRIMASFCRQMAGTVNATNFTVVLIQHLITNTSGYGAKWQVDGGEKIKYQLDISMMTKGATEKWGDDRKPAGQIIEWDVMKSALGQSGMSCKSCLRYGYGLDEAKEIVSLCIELGIIEKAKGGGWFTLADGSKHQGEDKLCAAIKEMKLIDPLFDQVKTVLGI